MFNIFKKNPQIEQKASAVGVMISSGLVQSKIYPPRNYDIFAREGYAQNVIAYRCINEIAKAASSVEWYVRNSENHPALQLLNRPNATQSLADLIHQLVSYYFISGNSFVEATTLGERMVEPRELWALRPDRMRVIAGTHGLPAAYEYEKGGNIRFACDQMTGFSKIHHWKCFHPNDDWYGLSPLQAAAFMIDQHNAAGIFNAALLQNGATPSGVMKVKTQIGNDTLFDKMKDRFFKDYQGAKNAGNPIFLDSDFDWIPMSTSPKDLQIFQGLDKAAEAICTAVGVPVELILPIGTTYANKSEARAIFWENTVIPLVKQLRDGLLNGWLAEFYPKDTPEFYYDENDITALMPRRAEYQKTITGLYRDGLITRNQALTEINMDTVGGGDVYSGRSMPAVAPATPAITPPIAKSLNNIETKSDDGLMAIANDISDASTVEQVQSMFAELVVIFGNRFLEEAQVASQLSYTAELQQYVTTHAAELITQVDSTTRGLVKAQIIEVVQNGEGSDQLKARLQKMFAELKPWRSQMIATTEVTQAMGQSSLIAAKQAGIKRLEWLSVIDGATRDTHLGIDGKVINVGEKFVLSDGDAAATVGQFANSSNNINCRCAVVAAFDGQLERSDFESRRITWKRFDDFRTTHEKNFAAAYFTLFENQLLLLLRRIDDVA